MSLSRGGFELNEIWASQANLVEMDLRLRKLEREASTGDPEARERHRQALLRLGPEHHAELIRAGHSGDVMAHHVREHAKAAQEYEKSRDADGKPSDSGWRNEAETRNAIRQHHREHGDHPADHVKRGENETPRQFGDRLRSLTLTNSTVYPPGRSSEHDHGTITYDHDEEDKDGHAKNCKAMATAWEREVPGGHAPTHNKTYGDGGIKGSVVAFRTGPRSRR